MSSKFYLGLFSGILDWWGNTIYESSLRWYAPETSISDDIDLQNNQHHYKEMGLQCHGALGVKSIVWANRMMPAPPKLWTSTKKMEDGEIRVIRHGTKMTGMLSFGPVQEEQEIWNIVAFTRKMDSLTPRVQQEFQAFVKKLSRHKHC